MKIKEGENQPKSHVEKQGLPEALSIHHEGEPQGGSSRLMPAGGSGKKRHEKITLGKKNYPVKDGFAVINGEKYLVFTQERLKQSIVDGELKVRQNAVFDESCNMVSAGIISGGNLLFLGKDVKTGSIKARGDIISESGLHASGSVSSENGMIAVGGILTVENGGLKSGKTIHAKGPISVFGGRITSLNGGVYCADSIRCSHAIDAGGRDVLAYSDIESKDRINARYTVSKTGIVRDEYREKEPSRFNWLGYYFTDALGRIESLREQMPPWARAVVWGTLTLLFGPSGKSLAQAAAPSPKAGVGSEIRGSDYWEDAGKAA